MTIDTIFLCFCEDCERNDGISRPYYMSRSLMQFVQDSKKALNVSDASASGKAWSTMASDASNGGGGIAKTIIGPERSSANAPS